MIIKKYNVETDSIFNQTLILSLLEKGEKGFEIVDEVGVLSKYNIFKYSQNIFKSKNKDLIFNNLTRCIEIYLDDQYLAKTLILYSPNDKLYFRFRVDDNNPSKLYIQKNYIGSDLKSLELDYEKKKRNQFQGIDDFNKIKDINYLEYVYKQLIKNQKDKESIRRTIKFRTNSNFISDFARMVEYGQIKIDNLGIIDLSTFSRQTLSRNDLQKERKDVVVLNYDTAEIEYLIFTSRYKESLVNHYFLLKRITDNRYRFIREDTCLNRLFYATELKEIKYKAIGRNASKEISNSDYQNIYLKTIEYEKEEDIEDELENEIIIEETFAKDKEANTTQTGSLTDLLEKHNYRIVNGLVYFDDFETFPLAVIGDEHIRFKQNRYLNDQSLSNQISFKDTHKIESAMRELLENKPSSRVLSFEKNVNRLVKVKFNKENNNQVSMINDLEEEYKNLLDIDRRYQREYIRKIYQELDNWKSGYQPRENIILPTVKKDTTDVPVDLAGFDIILTNHIKERIGERISEMSIKEKSVLANKAFRDGVVSAYYYEKEEYEDIYYYLSYKQRKHGNKILKLYDNMIFIFSLQPPHCAVTVYPFDMESVRRFNNNRKRS